MNKQTRINKIQEIIERNKVDPFGRLEIQWEDELVRMNVYKIPLDYLVYNKYNGRILKIFGVFERLYSKKEYPGTGIGLSICKKIIDYHKGKIWIKSTEGKGSEFYFTILKNNY